MTMMASQQSCGGAVQDWFWKDEHEGISHAFRSAMDEGAEVNFEKLSASIHSMKLLEDNRNEEINHSSNDIRTNFTFCIATEKELEIKVLIDWMTKPKTITAL